MHGSFLIQKFQNGGKHSAVGGCSARVAPDNPQNNSFAGKQINYVSCQNDSDNSILLPQVIHLQYRRKSM